MPDAGLDYDRSYYCSRESWPDFRIEARELVGLARLHSQARVLEVGCGGGELLRRLTPRVRLAVGVDLSPAGLLLAGATGGVRVVWARAESLPFAAGSFDAVVAQHLVEHLESPDQALQEWHRALRPGGILVLVTPNAAYPDPSHFHDPGHVHLFTASALRSALERNGFRVRHLSTLFPYLGRGRLARAAAIRLAPVARHLPDIAHRGRSLVAAAVAA